MGRGLSQLAAGVALAMMMGRLGRVLHTGPEYPQWQLIILAATLLGGVAWWLLDQSSTRTWPKLALFSLGGVLLGLRIAVPETLLGGFSPSGSTLPALELELGRALRVIESAVAPVVPTPGIVSILAIAMWGIGALAVHGYQRGPGFLMYVPFLAMYLQFAVYDRVNAGLGWLLPSAVAVTLALIAMAADRRGRTGRARDLEGAPVARRSTATAVVTAAALGIVSLFVANAAATTVSEYGEAPWRGSGVGSGPGSGGVSFDGLVGLRQRIISRSNTPLFQATLSPDAPPANQLYWRMEALDIFDGEEWASSSNRIARVDGGTEIVFESEVYRGTSWDFLQRVQIRELSQELVPTAGLVAEIQNPTDASNPRFPREFHLLGDQGAVALPDRLQTGDTYQLRTLLADQRSDLGALASTGSGGLSPIFESAAAAGEFAHEPVVNLPSAGDGIDRARYTDLPDSTPAAIESLARERTAGATTDFEKAWLLQAWFRDSGAFDYSTEVSTGHDALVLEDWLTDSTSPNYRTGYCEQFAASMAVLARSLDIPSRVVWGFTPGTVTEEGGIPVITIRDTNAHAWVEVWIEPWGWVQFDPTPRNEFQPDSLTAEFDPTAFLPSPEELDLIVPSSPTGNFGGELNIDEEGPSAIPTATPRYWLMAAVAIIALVASIPAAKAIRRRRRLQRVRDGDITAAWEELVDRLTDLGRAPTESATPLEVAQANDPALLPLANAYSASIYGGRAAQSADEDLLGAEWWLERTTDRNQRVLAALSLKSIVQRDRR